MSPEEWALHFGAMLRRHREEIEAMESEMFKENGWYLIGHEDGCDPWLEGPWGPELGKSPTVEIDI